MQTKIACFISLLDCFRRKNASKCSTAQQRTLPTDRQERFYWRTPIPHGTHKHMHAHDRLPQPVRVYSVQHSTCIHMYSTCSVLYMYIVHCTVHVLYSRVVQLNDLAFRYKIVHSYTQTSAQSVESMNIRCKPKLVTVQSPQRKNKKARVPVSIIVVLWLVLGKKKVIFDERTRVTVKYTCITLVIWVLCHVWFWFCVSNLERDDEIVNRIPSYARVFDKASSQTNYMNYTRFQSHACTNVRAEEHVVHSMLQGAWCSEASNAYANFCACAESLSKRGLRHAFETTVAVVSMNFYWSDYFPFISFEHFLSWISRLRYMYQRNLWKRIDFFDVNTRKY